MINFINEFVYFDNKRIPSVDSVKSSSNSTNDPMFNPKTGKQLKNSAVQNKTQSGYRKFPYSLLPLAVTSSNAVSYMSDTENVDDEYWNRIDELLNDLSIEIGVEITQDDLVEFDEETRHQNWETKNSLMNAFLEWWDSKDLNEVAKNKMKGMVEDVVNKKFPEEVLNNLKKYGDITKNGIPDIEVISEENPLLVRKVKNLIDIIKKNQADGQQKGVVLNFLINNIDTIDIPAEYKKEMLKKLQ
jgi:hypothetical protein